MIDFFSPHLEVKVIPNWGTLTGGGIFKGRVYKSERWGPLVLPIARMQLPYKLLSLAYLALSAVAVPTLPTTVQTELDLSYAAESTLDASIKSAISTSSGILVCDDFKLL